MTDNTEFYKEMLVRQIEQLGLTAQDLIEMCAGSGTAPVTVAGFIDSTVWPAYASGSRKVYGPYFAAIKHGLPGLCSCRCDACLDHFRADSTWEPCPCVTAGTCRCAFDPAAKGRVAADTCLTTCTGLGDRPLRAVTAADWTQLQYWVQTRADKRTAVRNRARARRGAPTFQHDGRSAAEHLQRVIAAIYRHAGGEVPGVHDGMAKKLPKLKRAVAAPRSYTADQVDELWTAIFLSGGDDPDLDMVLIWVLLETGSRRSGPIKARINDIKFHVNKVGLGEKGDNYIEQPVSERLIRVLLHHALTRGDIVAWNPRGIPVGEITLEHVRERVVRLRTDQPVFYYRPKIAADGTKIPHPLGRKRFETLWRRLRAELPWLEEMHGRPHDLRKTMGTFVERAFGHAVAQGWLRHAVADTTGTYTKATADEIEQVRDWLAGEVD